MPDISLEEAMHDTVDQAIAYFKSLDSDYSYNMDDPDSCAVRNYFYMRTRERIAVTHNYIRIRVPAFSEYNTSPIPPAFYWPDEHWGRLLQNQARRDHEYDIYSWPVSRVIEVLEEIRDEQSS